MCIKGYRTYRTRIKRPRSDITDFKIMTTTEKLRIEGKIETARNMFKKGFELDIVLNITELTEQELKDYGVI
ncbi:hypothetical protein DQM68_01135 [Leptospira mayottensis]|nr:hypothetical protein DQM68_01135 [Leptospira mayottensis]AXR63307.1 hypothetical protein DQM28_02780 [Leptospira mayottensis]AXR67071.1 hypothetical protein DPV73_02655 [Leptospira mayottensis]AZQ01159.1 hypothetical protein LEP1GSC190_02850 [Leptospira mayottensis 200901116]TGN06439.1 hypothetical protein EHR03_10305 [Leptospira mayottensis]